MLCKLQSAESRIWTRVAVSISYDDNHHTKGTFYNSNLRLAQSTGGVEYTVCTTAEG